MSLRFVASLTVLACAVFLAYREEVIGPALQGLVLLTAETVFAILRLFSPEVVREGSVIRHASGFAYEIYYRCTGILPVVCLAVAILAYPKYSPRRKLVGLGLGLPLLLLLNILRLLHLFFVGIYSPRFVDLAHSVLWESGIIAAVVGFWLTWINWAASCEDRPDSVPGKPLQSSF